MTREEETYSGSTRLIFYITYSGPFLRDFGRLYHFAISNSFIYPLALFLSLQYTSHLIYHTLKVFFFFFSSFMFYYLKQNKFSECIKIFFNFLSVRVTDLTRPQWFGPCQVGQSDKLTSASTFVVVILFLNFLQTLNSSFPC